MKALAAPLMFIVFGLTGCSSCPPPAQPSYGVQPQLMPGAEYPMTPAPRSRYVPPAS